MEEASLVEVGGIACEVGYHLLLLAGFQRVEIGPGEAVGGVQADEVGSLSQQPLAVFHQGYALGALKASLSEQHGSQVCLFPLRGLVQYLLQTPRLRRGRKLLHAEGKAVYAQLLEMVAVVVNILTVLVKMLLKVHHIFAKMLILGVE